MQKNVNIDYYLIIILGLFFCALIIFISYFVGPLSDESLPIATSLRFIKGQRPFIDDYSAFIPFGLLLYPLIKLSLWLHNGNNELILFLRHSYIVFVFLLSAYTFFLIRKKLSLILSFFIFFGVSIFHPFGINNFHYDTLATLLWSNILFQFFSFQFIEPIRKIHFIIFSLFNLILCLAYPTFLFFLIPFYLIFSLFSQHSKKIFLFHMLIASFAGICIAFILFYYFKVSTQDLHNFLDFLHRLSLSSNQSLFDKCIELAHRIISKYSSVLFVALGSLFIAYIGRRHWYILLTGFITILVLPLFKINIQHAIHTDIFWVLNYTGFLSFPIFLIFLRTDVDSRALFYFIGLPSLAAGILTSVTAHMLDMNWIIGFFPASLLTYIFTFFIFQKYLRSESFLHYFATRAVLIFGLIELAFFQWNFIYGANYTGIALYKNSIKVDVDGPFSGLHVTPTCYTIVTELQKDLQILDVPYIKGFAYFGLFSAGYLFLTQLKPGEYVLYSAPGQNHFGEKIRTPNYVFDFSKLWRFPHEIRDDYLKGVQYRQIASRQFYDIYASEPVKTLELNDKSFSRGIKFSI
ncbi:hypothetical protein [Legionella sp. WA2024007413]